MISSKAALALLAAAGMLVGCGKQGELDRPAPLIGKAQAGPGQAKLTRDAAAARARGDGAANSDPPAPQSVDEVRNQGLPTQRERPIPGVSQGPNSPGPPGVLPDPVPRPGSIPP